MALAKAPNSPELRQFMTEQGLTLLSFPPLAADDNWFDASQVLAAGTGTPKVYVLTVLAAGMNSAVCPGYPVCPVGVVTDAAGDNWASVSAVVSGVTQFGNRYSETCAATNSSGTWTWTATKAYLSLVSVVTTVTCASGDVTASDAQIIGFVKTVGLMRQISATTDVIAKTFDGAADAGTISAVHSTYVIAGTPDAAKVLNLLIRPTLR